MSKIFVSFFGNKGLGVDSDSEELQVGEIIVIEELDQVRVIVVVVEVVDPKGWEVASSFSTFDDESVQTRSLPEDSVPGSRRTTW